MEKEREEDWKGRRNEGRKEGREEGRKEASNGERMKGRKKQNSKSQDVMLEHGKR